MSLDELRDFFRGEGLDPDNFWIGPEHPSLERAALRLLEGRSDPRVLEIGFQAGGFCVPLVLELGGSPGFRYVGVDNLAYSNAVPAAVIAEFFEARSLGRHVDLHVEDSRSFLRRVEGPFDLILLDHWKPLYPRDLLTVLRRGLVAEGGVILLHDVLDKAERSWKHCARVCAAFRQEWEIREDVPAGLAVVRSRRGSRPLPGVRWLAAAAEAAYDLALAGRRRRVTRA